MEDEESPDEEDYSDYYNDYFNFYGDDHVASSSPAEQKAEKDDELPPEVCGSDISFIYLPLQSFLIISSQKNCQNTLENL